MGRHDAAGEDRAGRRRRMLKWLSNGLFAAAVFAAAYPWTTGLYTLYEQRQLKDRLDRAPLAAPSQAAATTPTSPFDGWAQQDGAFWRGLKDGDPFGQLRISRIGVDVTVIRGVRKADLKEGPGWIPGTALPGVRGNVGISGHRTTYLAPFRRLNELRSGDLIELESPYRIYRYRLLRTFAVRPEQVGVLAQTRESLLTLTACHPPFSAKSRLIAQARLESVTVKRAAGR